MADTNRSIESWQHLPEVQSLPIDVYGGLANFDDDLDGLDLVVSLMRSGEWLSEEDLEGVDRESATLSPVEQAVQDAADILEPIARRIRAARERD